MITKNKIKVLLSIILSLFCLSSCGTQNNEITTTTAAPETTTETVAEATTEETAEANNYYIVNTESSPLRMRESPNTDAKVLASIPKGTGFRRRTNSGS